MGSTGDASVEWNVSSLVQKLRSPKRPVRKSTFGVARRDVKDVVTSGEGVELLERRGSFNDRIKKNVADFTAQSYYKFFMAVVIVFNILIGVIETDERAAERTPPQWTLLCSHATLGIYMFDIFLRVIAYGKQILLGFANLFDIFVVIVDICATLASAFLVSDGHAPATSIAITIAFLRGLRMLRTFRVLRNFFAFRELYVMMHGFATALRTLIFGLALVFVVLTSWSILAVEVLNPINQRLFEDGVYLDCERCRRAFQTVMNSNLTFIKTILAGDSWGELSVPLIETSPTATVILVCVFVSLQWGLMNIMTAVIVDNQAAARARDDKLTAILKQEELETSYETLFTLFTKMDKDGNGALTLAELMKSYKTQGEFYELLQLMDITSEDLPLIFEILDTDHSGEITYAEFVTQLHAIKLFDSHTLLIFIRHLVTSRSDEILRRVEKVELALNSSLGRMQGVESGLGQHSIPLSEWDVDASPKGSLATGQNSRYQPPISYSLQLDEAIASSSLQLTAIGENNTMPFIGQARSLSRAPTSTLASEAHQQPFKASSDMYADAQMIGEASSQPFPSPTLATLALLTDLQTRLHQDLEDTIAFASEKFTKSREWLQGAACSPCAGSAGDNEMANYQCQPATRLRLGTDVALKQGNDTVHQKLRASPGDIDGTETARVEATKVSLLELSRHYVLSGKLPDEFDYGGLVEDIKFLRERSAGASV